MEVINNHKGGMKLIREGYMCTKMYTGQNIRRESSGHTAFSYKGDVTTNAHITVTRYTAHNHHAQDQAVTVAKLFSTLKEYASGSRGTLSQLVAD